MKCFHIWIRKHRWHRHIGKCKSAWKTIFNLIFHRMSLSFCFAVEELFEPIENEMLNGLVKFTIFRVENAFGCYLINTVEKIYIQLTEFCMVYCPNDRYNSTKRVNSHALLLVLENCLLWKRFSTHPATTLMIDTSSFLWKTDSIHYITRQ